MAFQRGLSEEHEQKSTQLLRDTRTIGQKIGDFFKIREAVVGFYLFLVLAIFVFPVSLITNYV